MNTTCLTRSLGLLTALSAWLGAAALAPAGPSMTVLLIGDGDGDALVQETLETAGHTVLYAGSHWEWDGVTPDISTCDVALFLDGNNPGYVMDPVAQTALVDFMAAGGGLVITEWAAYDTFYDDFACPAISPALPVVSLDGDVEDETMWTVLDPMHLLAAYLPSSWEQYSGFSIAEAVPEATVVVEDPAGVPLVTYRDDLAGLVVHLNHDVIDTSGELNARMRRLFDNAVRFAGGETPADCDDNGIPDHYEISQDPRLDIDRNDVLDVCEDCNGNGLPDGADIEELRLAPTAYEFEGIANLDWLNAGDDNWSPVTSLPFALQLAGETYVAFVQDANGYVELLRDGETPYGFGEGNVADLVVYDALSGGPDHTYLLAAYDDLTSEHYGCYGYRVESDRIVFYWIVETSCDAGSELLLESEIVLSSDGRVDWNFRNDEYSCFDYDLYSGLYLGHAVQQFQEVFRQMFMGYSSWAWREGFDVEQVNYNFTTERSLLSWQDSEDDACSDVIPLPHEVSFGHATFVAFAQESNGYVELLQEGELPYAFGLGSVQELINYDDDTGGPTHTYLIAAFDDLSSEYNGLYGHRFTPEGVYFYWNTETYQDAGAIRLSEFEIFLAYTNTVQWNFHTADYGSFDYDLFSGIYLGYSHQELYEITNGRIPREQSWLFDEGGVLGGGSDDDNGNGIPDECELDGDVDGDGDVDQSDLGQLLAAYNACDGDPNWNPDADFDDSGCVDQSDLGVLLANYGMGV
jgi:hypothetical protein